MREEARQVEGGRHGEGQERALQHRVSTYHFLICIRNIKSLKSYSLFRSILEIVAAVKGVEANLLCDTVYQNTMRLFF